MREIGKHVVVLAASLAYFFVAGPSMVRQPERLLADRGDSLFNAWIMAWDAHALATPGADIWSPPIFDPAPNMLTFSETMFGTLWYSAPVNLLTDNPVLAANVHTAAAFVLCSYAVFLLVRGLTGSFLAGLAAGMLFSFNPIRWGQFPHMNLLSFYFAPIALLFAHRFLETGSKRAFFAAVAALAGQYYLSLNLGTLSLTMLLVYAVAYCAIARTGRERWFLLGKWPLFIAGAALGAVLLAPLMPAYARVVRDWPVTRTQAENASFSCELLGFFSPASSFRNYRAWADLLESRVLGQCWLGFAPWVFGIAAVAAVRARFGASSRDATVVAVLAAVAVVCAVMMLGPNLVWMKHKYDVPLPQLLVFYVVPGGKGMRVPSRFFLPLLLCLSTLAGFLIAHVERKGLWKNPWGALAAIVVLVGWFGFDYAVAEDAGVAIPRKSEFPPVYAYLAGGPRDAPIVEIPASPTHQFEYQYFQTAHWRPLVNGTSGSYTPGNLALWKRTEGPPTEETLKFLSILGAKTIVVHIDRLDAAIAPAWLKASLTPYGFRRGEPIGDAVVWERIDPVPEASAKLRVTGVKTSSRPGMVRDRVRLEATVVPADPGKPWRYLRRGIDEVVVVVVDPSGRESRMPRTFNAIAYLVPGESGTIVIEPLDGVPPAGATLRIEGDRFEPFETKW